MANSKISALTSATVPLDGTEVLPIVQGGITKKVSNNDLRPKQIQSNATSGVLQVAGPAAASTRVMTTPDANFTVARTDASQSFTGDQTLSAGNLIQGTAAKGINFTANSAAAGMTSQLLNYYEEGTWTPADASGAGLTLTKNGTQYYTRVGRLITAYFDVTYPVTANASQAVLSLPISTSKNGSGILSYSDYTTLTVWWLIGSSGMAFYYPGGTLANVNISGKRFVGSMTYIV